MSVNKLSVIVYERRDLGKTQGQARELILGPHPGTKVKFLSFNRTQSGVVTDLLTGHNTLRRHLYLLGLLDSPLCRGCGVKRKTRPTFFVNARPWLHSDICIWLNINYQLDALIIIYS